MKIYISNYLSHSISIINYETLETEREIVLNNNIYPHHFCVDEQEKKIFIPSLINGTLYAVDIISGKILDSISVGGSLSQIFMHEDELFVSNEDTNSIYIINKYTLDPITMISVDDMPHGFGYYKKNKRLYVPCINSIVCIDIENKSIYKKIDTDFKAWHLEIDEKREEIYVGKIKINGIPQGLEISNDYSRLFVSDTENGEIKVFDTKTNQLMKAIHVGKEPTTIVCL